VSPLPVTAPRPGTWGRLRGAPRRWEAPLEPSTPGEGEVHVWRLRMSTDPLHAVRLASLLDARERERAGRFHFPAGRERFVASHGVLRILLSLYTGVPPEELTIDRAPGGKPSLASARTSEPLSFNMSHALDGALFAFCPGEGELGVDVEHVSADAPIDEMSRASLSERERIALEALPRAQRRETFFRWWTRKEAVLKATGQGLAAPLESLSVIPPDLLPPGDADEDPAGVPWCVWDLEPWRGFAGALACRAGCLRVRLFDAGGAAARFLGITGRGNA